MNSSSSSIGRPRASASEADGAASAPQSRRLSPAPASPSPHLSGRPSSVSIYVRDPVHGTLSFTDTEQRLIDTPIFQRLRGIKQLAMAHLVYPGAHHTRFEHSLGTLHLADQMARALELDEDVRRRLRLAALLHDVGHIAFSHEAEEVTSGRLGDHEKIGAQRIHSSPLSDILSESDDAKTISSWAQGASYGQLISSDIGADRIDYLLRDAHYTGVAYGVIDRPRILTTLAWHQNQLAMQGRGLEAAESLILARFAMFHTVYFHHAVRIARLMLQQALRAALSDVSFDWPAASLDGDREMMARLSHLSHHGGNGSSTLPACEWVARLEERRLFKRALFISWKSLPVRLQQSARAGTLSRHLSEQCNCPVLVDAPSRFSAAVSLPVLMPGGPQPLSECSPILASLQAAADERATLLVCCDEKDREKVASAAKKELEG